jgi:hypothetical protein
VAHEVCYVCHHLNVGVETKLAKDFHFLITINFTFAHNQNKKNGIDLTINIVSFKTNVFGTLDILPTPRELKQEVDPLQS